MRRVYGRRLHAQFYGLWLVGLGIVLCLGMALGMVVPTDRDAAPSFAVASHNSVAAKRGTQALDRDVVLDIGQILNVEPAVAGATQARQITAAIEAKPSAWSTVVTVDPSATATGRIRSAKPGDWQARTELARDLQKALTRAGCYGGEISGSWTQSTRRAMAAFIAKVNASLPVAEPDYILLTLVQSHPTTVCGSSCGRNEVTSDDGRCVPHAIMAQSEKTRARHHAAGTAIIRPDDAARVGAAPIFAAPVVAPPVVFAPAYPARVAAMQPTAVPNARLDAAIADGEKLPWRADNRRAEATAERPSVGARTYPARTRPDGMMSVGAPQVRREITVDIAAIDAAVATVAATAAASSNVHSRQPPSQRIAAVRDEQLPQLHIASIEPLSDTDVTEALTRSPDRVDSANANTVERGRKDRTRRSYRKAPRRDLARRAYRRQYSGYAWAQPSSYRRRYFKRRFMAPFNMIQRLDGIY